MLVFVFCLSAFEVEFAKAETHILEVELEKAETTSTSRSSRTTRSESFALLRSSDSFLNAFSRILCVLQILYFRNRIVFLFEVVDDLLYGIFCHACW